MNKDFWWVNSSAESSDSASAEISFTLALKYRDVSKFKRVVWYWYRENVARKDLNSSSKLVLWAICERMRYESMSMRDAYAYVGKMLGLSRVSVSKSVYALVDKEIIWIVEEGRERKGMKRLPQHSRKRKHILLVGLGKLLSDHLV